jgi:hypothetical protein
MRLRKFSRDTASDFRLEYFETGICLCAFASVSKVGIGGTGLYSKSELEWNGRNHGTLPRVSSLDHVSVIIVRDFGTGDSYLPKRPSHKSGIKLLGSGLAFHQHTRSTDMITINRKAV